MLDGFTHLSGYFAPSEQVELIKMVQKLVAQAPLFRPKMPRSGKPFSVKMTNCGELGWVSDKDGGYRYQATHPETSRAWPRMPERFLELWADVADCPADPEACLINYYAAGTKLGSHVDSDEAETRAPVVSVSLGDDAVFHVGGLKRSDPKTRLVLKSGDVAILGGESRLAYHGIDRVMKETSELIGGGGRFNLTLRRVTPLPM
jgi:alkylated DNA repair protein (DNA oxidative demethylase)